ncbi:MAG: hypothetical protein CMA63_00185 [Euryarchaeota archaeon]|nr:hypothetical protein [Euryarchaeota archaeon]|tara:strand:+ start:45352 stop:46497 length:1146 start_codon:yes stop_codon:yes gene_type:complete
MSAIDTNALIWAAGLLSIPLLLAVPMKIAWRFFIGVGHEASQYRSTVLQIIDAGRQVAPFRATLDDISRSLHIRPSHQRLIEADLFHPLTVSHFLLLPAIIIFPLAVIMALPVILIGFPILLVIEIILIRRGVLVFALKSIEKMMHWQIIHIPKPYRGLTEQKAKMNEFSQHVTHFNHVPQGAFLGLFAWLIVHWTLNLESWGLEIIFSSGLYIILLGLLGVLNAAFEADLVFVDPSKGRLVPVDQWLESILKPLVGIGLLFLTARNLLDEARDGNAVLFAATVLCILYGAAVVGISFRWGYSIWRGSTVRVQFSEQVIEQLNPLSYDLTRTKGRIEFHVRMAMGERMNRMLEAPVEQLSFADLQELPSSEHRGKIPDNPL